MAKLPEIKTIKINVMRKDIKAGVVRSADRCPIALAINRKIKDTDEVCVANDKVNFNEFTESDLPEEACQFYHDFDHQKPVKPIKFEIEIPTRFLK